MVTVLEVTENQAAKDFNPHHPQGGDDFNDAMGIIDKDFNPHHPQGGDSESPESVLFFQISIHTTRKVVTYFPPVFFCHV